MLLLPLPLAVDMEDDIERMVRMLPVGEPDSERLGSVRERSRASL